MFSYPVHTIESAPTQSKPVLQQLQQAFGLIPNIAAVMAASPVLINGFIGLFERVHASSLTEPQIQTLLLTNAVTNASEWAVAFHTALALKQGVHPADVDAIRHGRPPNDVGLASLSTLARTLIEKRGHLSESDQRRFFDVGFSPRADTRSHCGGCRVYYYELHGQRYPAGARSAVRGIRLACPRTLSPLYSSALIRETQ